MSAYAIPFNRHLFSASFEPVARWFSELKQSKASMIVPRHEEQASPLSQIQLISHKVFAHTKTLSQLAEQLRVQAHEKMEGRFINAEKTVSSLTDFCQTVTQELDPMNALVQPDVSAVRVMEPNGLSQEAIHEFIQGLLHNRRSVEKFMAAFLTASYQRPNGYQLCLAVVGSHGNDSVGRAGVEVLRNLGLMGFKQLPELMMASAIAAVVNCCWSLERASEFSFR